MKVTTVREVSMWHSASHGGVVAFEANGDHWPESDWTPAMHAAAEELRAQGAELGENRGKIPTPWVDRDGSTWFFSDPALTGGMRWQKGSPKAFVYLRDAASAVTNGCDPYGGLNAAFLAWHSRAYTLLPDECRERGKPPRKMVDGEMRGPNGEPLKLFRYSKRHPAVHFPNAHHTHTLDAVAGGYAHEISPFNDAEQAGRAARWLLSTLEPHECLTDDGLSARAMAPNEVRDVVTGKGLGMYVVLPGIGAVGIGPKDSAGNAQWLYCPPRTAEQHIAEHPCSLPSNRLRVEAFLKASTCACNGTGRKTEESDGTTRTSDALAQVEVGDAVRASGIPAVDGEPGEGGLPSVPPGDAGGQAERPPCVPSHIPDTDWTVIEGRAVWREEETLFIDDDGAPPFGIEQYHDWEGWDSLPDGGAITPVHQSLFLAARRWMGWEPALTPVDLTELREAYVALNGMYAGNKVGPLLGSVNDLVAAVEKLLSSGGAP